MIISPEDAAAGFEVQQFDRVNGVSPWFHDFQLLSALLINLH